MLGKENYNTRDDTANPMRDAEVVARNLATRGDKQKGMGSSTVKLEREQYMELVELLLEDATLKQVGDIVGLSESACRAVSIGKSHEWLAEHPLYKHMLKYRAKFRRLAPEWGLGKLRDYRSKN